MCPNRNLDAPKGQEDDDVLVSIIVNCYNGEKYLSVAIRSVLAQTYKNWELIFWDNQSTDASAQIFNEFTDSRLHYYYAPKHTLLYEARNLALEKCKGEFIAFLDVDDWWEADKLTRQVALFFDSNVGLVYSNFWLFNVNTQKSIIAYRNPLPSGDVLAQQLKNYSIGMLTIMVRRSEIDRLTYVFEPRYQIIGDFDLVIRLASKCNFASIDKPLAYYRLHDESLSAKYRDLQNLEMQHWIEKTRSYNEIFSSDGYFHCELSLLYSQAREAAEKSKWRRFLKIFIQLPLRLKAKVLVIVFLPRKILQIIGRA